MMLFSVKDGVGLGDIRHINGCSLDAMDKHRACIHADVPFIHSEVPLTAFLGLVHLGIALSLSPDQSLLRNNLVHLGKKLLSPGLSRFPGKPGFDNTHRPFHTSSPSNFARFCLG
jgi:hypothetical protein